MKKLLMITAFFCSLVALAQQPQLTPKQKIDRQRKVQVTKQVSPDTTQRLENARTQTTTINPQNSNATPQLREIPAQQNTNNLGGAGTSGTAGNTIGAPNQTVKTTGEPNGAQVPVPTNSNPPTPATPNR